MLIPRAAISAASRRGDRVTSRGITTRVAPLSSAPHTSKMAASNAGLERWDTRSPGAIWR